LAGVSDWQSTAATQTLDVAFDAEHYPGAVYSIKGIEYTDGVMTINYAFSSEGATEHPNVAMWDSIFLESNDNVNYGYGLNTYYFIWSYNSSIYGHFGGSSSFEGSIELNAAQVVSPSGLSGELAAYLSGRASDLSKWTAEDVAGLLSWRFAEYAKFAFLDVQRTGADRVAVRVLSNRDIVAEEGVEWSGASMELCLNNELFDFNNISLTAGPHNVFVLKASEDTLSEYKPSVDYDYVFVGIMPLPGTSIPVPPWTTPTEEPWQRLDGNKGDSGTRYDTMQSIVETGWGADGSDYVVVASGENFPDALAASSLAGIYGAPVVLTTKGTLTTQAEDTIKALGATKAYVIGGTEAVALEVEQSLSGIEGMEEVKRIEGIDRFATALDIYREGKETDSWGTTAIIANGFNFADALSISPFANVTGSPIFLASLEKGLDADTLKAINEGGFKRIVITGGDKAVSPAVEDQLAESGATVLRVFGENRYETSAAIIEFSQDNSALRLDRIICATGANFPDALAGGAFAGHIGSALLLVHSTAEGGQAGLESIIKAHPDEIGLGYVLGGAAAVPEELRQILEAGSRIPAPTGRG
jgi:putative cell wall-binding protein